MEIFKRISSYITYLAIGISALMIFDKIAPSVMDNFVARSSLLFFTALFAFILEKLILNSARVQPYSIAIIGLPQSGKTTLIISLFQEIFRKKVLRVQATLKGESTIARVNDLMEKKESGIPFGPTDDQTMFAYRTNIRTRELFFKKEYRVEFGDYPGEYSESLATDDYLLKGDKKYVSDLKKSEFFKWCLEAQAYIFVVDIYKYLYSPSKEEFIASSKRLVRESCQFFIDSSSENANTIKKRPVLLIFNKMDLFQRRNQEERITDDGILPGLIELENKLYSESCRLLEKDFDDLIIFLNSEFKQFHVLFTSNFATLNNNLVDIKNIIKHILPTRAKL